MVQKNARSGSLELKALRRRFDHWRKSGRKGRKIPNALWCDAAALVRSHGLSCVAKDLSLDYNGLKRRVNEGIHPEANNLPDIDGSGFIELSMEAVMEKPACILELASWRGQLTIRLKGYPPADVVSLAVEPADFRCGIDGLARRYREALSDDPFSGALFVFRNRSRKAIKILVYDGQGFWLCHKRLFRGQFRYWPRNGRGGVRALQAHELQVLLQDGDPDGTDASRPWRGLSRIEG